MPLQRSAGQQHGNGSAPPGSTWLPASQRTRPWLEGACKHGDSL